ncbi:(2Fe-2S)-binding protein [Phenylobacterium sp.]|uniref:(2Fe-2S)-binding protein n=1 Tax=Phenylobacterium sp. TaxID=1871053 RepID=UPI002611562D|nr:(2Fe-2S)-binding protein [Phenylobacterium sp.]
MKLSLTVNETAHELEVAPNALLVEIIRGDLGLTGTHVGCDTSQCGACTVEMDGRAVKSCTVLAGQAQDARVTTIEGLGAPGNLHPMQTAFQAHHALQCGFCTPGMIISAIDLVKRADGRLDEAAVREGLAGNLCRCTGYHNIVEAVLAAAGQM